MFYSCSKLKTIYAGDKWSTAKVTNSAKMFYGCKKLVGGNGTIFSSSYIDKTYARIDKSGKKGYFTEMPMIEPGVLFSGQMFAKVVKNSSAYSVSNSTITKIVFKKVAQSPANGTPVGNKVYATGIGTSTVTISSVYNIFANPNSSSMFYFMTGLTSIDFSNFDTSNVTTMSSMFVGCSGLSSLNLSGFNTSKVTTMSSMFSACSKLTGLDLSHFDTSKVKYMTSMFNGCSGLSSLDLSSFNTSNVTGMSYMFYGCSGLTSLDLSTFNTAKVTRMDYMFYGCSGLTTIYVGGEWSTILVSISESMFYGCTKLKGMNGTSYSSSYVDGTYARIDWPGSINDGTHLPGYLSTKLSSNARMLISGEDFNKVLKNNTEYAFDADEVVEKIVFSNVTTLPTGVDVSLLQDGSIVATGIGTNVVTIASTYDIYANTNSSYMFSYFSVLKEIDFSNFNTGRVNDMSYMFRESSCLTSLDLSCFSTRYVTDMQGMFNFCTNLQSLNISSFNTTNVTDMSYMFGHLDKLSGVLDLQHFNTEKVEDMSGMFSGCTNLQTVEWGSCDTSNVTDMSVMFYECSNLTSMDLSGFDAQSVTEMSTMFYNCTSLQNVNMPYIQFTHSLDDMSFMFYNCTSLQNVNISYFRVSNVEDMSNMFYNCQSLTVLDLSSFRVTSANIDKMFYNCVNLQTIYASRSWSCSSGTDTFWYCEALAGVDMNDGYKWSYTFMFRSGAEAKVNGLNGDVGYFTYKAPSSAVSSSGGNGSGSGVWIASIVSIMAIVSLFAVQFVEDKRRKNK